MHPVSEEILEHWQIRKTGKQKAAFLAFMQENFPVATVESGGLGKNRNLIIGNPDEAEFVFGAHYDTCAALPFPNLIFPKNIVFSLLYSVLIALPFLIISEIVLVGLLLLTDHFALAYAASMLALFGSLIGVMMIGIPNRHTANDNTSGVVMLTELILTLPEDLRRKCAFVFFDNEENGLLGSAYFNKKHKAAMKNKVLINLDCVGDGEYILIAPNKPAQKKYGDQLNAAFVSNETHTVLLEKAGTTFYPSDQANFPVSVAVAALKKNRFFGYYMNRIHTKRDTVCEEANIRYLTDRFAAFLRFAEEK